MSETTAYTDFRLHANRLAETGERGQAEAKRVVSYIRLLSALVAHQCRCVSGA
jgi:hypothetical protein